MSHDDILEISLTQLNVGGVRACLKFLNSLRPKEFIFHVMRRLVSRLIDAGRFSEIDELLQLVQKNTYHVVAIVSELEKVGRFTQAENLEKCLNGLVTPPKNELSGREIILMIP